ncbi:MAG TPA: PilZ domain-containing protein [Kofleriaceae bacterium]|nr:PilZ domain-containing protein [Kofleriaceae bacterium]
MLASPIRRHRRVPCDRPAVLEVPTPSGPERSLATVKALSLGGLGLAFDEWETCDVNAGDVVFVHLRSPRGALVLPARVAWIRHDHSARFDLGVMLLRERLDHVTAASYRALVAEADEHTTGAD